MSSTSSVHPPQPPAADPWGRGVGPDTPEARRRPEPPAGRPSSAWGIIGIVLGGLALLLSWVPIINTLALVLGLIGLALGIVALVQAIRRRGPRALGIIAVVLSALSIVIVLATQAFYGAVLDEVAESLDESAGATASAPAEQAAASEGAEAGSEPAVPAADDVSDGAAGETGSAPSGTLALGQSAAVGRYTVTVDEVDLDATESVLAMNQFNGAPENDAYATVVLTVTYDGEDEGMPAMDLDIELLGGDQRNYATYSCGAITGDLEDQMQGLRAGGTSTFTECFDIPAAATQDAQIRVADQLDFGSEPALWSAV